MAGEFKHVDVGNLLTKGEWESIIAHELDGQESGDLLVVNSTAQSIVRLPIGSEDEVLTVNSDGVLEWVDVETIMGAVVTAIDELKAELIIQHQTVNELLIQNKLLNAQIQIMTGEIILPEEITIGEQNGFH